jgi:hypothetical protein
LVYAPLVQFRQETKKPAGVNQHAICIRNNLLIEANNVQVLTKALTPLPLANAALRDVSSITLPHSAASRFSLWSSSLATGNAAAPGADRGQGKAMTIQRLTVPIDREL